MIEQSSSIFRMPVIFLRQQNRQNNAIDILSNLGSCDEESIFSNAHRIKVCFPKDIDSVREQTLMGSDKFEI